MQRIIVDVDAGADDSVALFLLLHADKIGKIKLESIICSAGNTTVDHVIKNVVRLLETAKRTDIPVYRGAAEQLIPAYFEHDNFHGVDGFADLHHDHIPDVSIVKNEHASIVVGKFLRENPGKITYMALGPLTTLALAIELHPDFSKNVKELAIMGGNNKAVGNTPNAAEFNFFFDPEAAFIVLEKCKSPIILLPWETCLLPQIPMLWRQDILGGIDNPTLQLIDRAERKTYAKRTMWLSCDGFLAAAYLYPECIKKREWFHSTIELHGKRTRGQLVLDHRNKHLPTYESNVTVIEDICGDALMKIFLNAAKEM